MRRFVLGAVLACGLSAAVAGSAAAQGPGYGWPCCGVPDYGYGTYGLYGAYAFGGYPFGTVPGYAPWVAGAPGFAPPATGPFGVPPSYYYPYGAVTGEPLYGVQSGVGFTFNALNYAPFSTVSSTNTSTIPNIFGLGGARTSLTILPLSAAGRISVVPTNAGNSTNVVIIR